MLIFVWTVFSNTEVGVEKEYKNYFISVPLFYWYSKYFVDRGSASDIRIFIYKNSFFSLGLLLKVKTIKHFLSRINVHVIPYICQIFPSFYSPPTVRIILIMRKITSEKQNNVREYLPNVVQKGFLQWKLIVKKPYVLPYEIRYTPQKYIFE